MSQALTVGSGTLNIVGQGVSCFKRACECVCVIYIKRVYTVLELNLELLCMLGKHSTS